MGWKEKGDERKQQFEKRCAKVFFSTFDTKKNPAGQEIA
jgi:hypothetical protein